MKSRETVLIDYQATVRFVVVVCGTVAVVNASGGAEMNAPPPASNNSREDNQ
jgi:hypothetical protein